MDLAALPRRGRGVRLPRWTASTTCTSRASRTSSTIEAIYERHAGLFTRARRCERGCRGGGHARELLLEFAVHGPDGARDQGRGGGAGAARGGARARGRTASAMPLPRRPPWCRRTSPTRTGAPRSRRRGWRRLGASSTRCCARCWSARTRSRRELGLAELCARCARSSRAIDLGALERADLRLPRRDASARTRRCVEPPARAQLGFGFERAAPLRPAATSSARRRSTPRSPSERLLERLRADARRARARARRRNVHPRRRAAAEEDAARVLRAGARAGRGVPGDRRGTGGRDDYETLFHEGGHAEHFAHMARALPMELRYLGRQLGDRGLRVPVPAPDERPGLAARPPGTWTDPEAIEAHARARQARVPAPLRREAVVRAGAARRAGRARPAARRLRAPARRERCTSTGRPRAGSATSTRSSTWPAYLRAWALETHTAPRAARALRRALVRAARGRRLPQGALEGRAAADGGSSCSEELTGETLDFAALLDDLRIDSDW